MLLGKVMPRKSLEADPQLDVNWPNRSIEMRAQQKGTRPPIVETLSLRLPWIPTSPRRAPNLIDSIHTFARHDRSNRRHSANSWFTTGKTPNLKQIPVDFDSGCRNKPRFTTPGSRATLQLREDSVTVKQLNCEGLNCPMPIVELTKAARELQSGDKIEVTATDLAFKPDLEAWARRMNHTIEQFDDSSEIQKATITLG